MNLGERWAVEWHSVNRIDGDRREWLWNGVPPLLFLTRQEAREWIRERYGYISGRDDLQQEPHGWRMPKAVKVTVRLEAIR